MKSLIYGHLAIYLVGLQFVKIYINIELTINILKYSIFVKILQ